MRKIIYIPFILCSFNSISKEIPNYPYLSNYSTDFQKSYHRTISKKYNFDKNKFLIKYKCGINATCASIYNPSNLTITEIPGAYIKSEKNDTKIIFKYSIKSDDICINGTNIVDSSVYKNACYTFISGKIFQQKNRIKKYSVPNTFIFNKEKITVDLSFKSQEFIDNFWNLIKIGPNFDHDKYIISWSPGASAIAFTIYDAHINKFTYFPDIYTMDYDGGSQESKFIYNKKSNKFCITSESAEKPYFFDNKCYFYNRGIIKDFK